MLIYHDPPPSYKVDDFVWNSERWGSDDREATPKSTTRQLSIWEQNNAIVFDLPELSVYIVDRSALTCNDTLLCPSLSMHLEKTNLTLLSKPYTHCARHSPSQKQR